MSLSISQLSLAEASKRPLDEGDPLYQVKPGVTPALKKRKLASKENVCEEIVAILFSNYGDLEPGEHETFKTTLHSNAQDYPLITLSSLCHPILKRF